MPSARSSSPWAGESPLWSDLNVFAFTPEVSLRGEPLRDLAERCSFEDVAALLLYGSLPSVDLSADVQCRMAEIPPLDPAIDEWVRGLPWHLTLGETLKGALLILARFDERQDESEDESIIDRCLTVMVQLIRIVAMRYCLSQSVPLPREEGDDPLAGLFLQLVRGDASEALERQALDTFLVLNSIEPEAPSDLAVRAVAAGGGEYHEALLAGCSAGGFARHDRETAAVIEFLDRIESEKDLHRVADELRTGGRDVPALAERLSACEQMRNALLMARCRELSIDRRQEGFEQIVTELEAAVAPRVLRPAWGVARLFHYLGLEHELLEPLLALARIPCWTACFLEQRKFSSR
jgi:citrate synthase